MPNIEYHKGHLCICQAIMCQEGFCQDCMIYRNQIWQAESLSSKNLEPVASKRRRSLAGACPSFN